MPKYKSKIKFIRTDGTTNVFRSDEPREPRKKPTPRKNELIELWNSLPGLRQHKPGTELYKSITKALNELEKSGFSTRPWKTQWIERARIRDKFLYEPWPRHAIERAIQILSQMTQPGYWPGPNSFLSRWDLLTTIYNPRTQTSMLVQARSNAVATLFKSKAIEDNEHQLNESEKLFRDTLREHQIATFDIYAIHAIVNMYNILSEDIRFNHLCSSVVEFGHLYGEWLSYNNFSTLESAMAPSDGWVWIRFYSDFFEGSE